MPLTIRSAAARSALRELSALTAETATEALVVALRERLERERRRRTFGMIRDEMQRIREQQECTWWAVIPRRPLQASGHTARLGRNFPRIASSTMWS